MRGSGLPASPEGSCGTSGLLNGSTSVVLHGHVLPNGPEGIIGPAQLSTLEFYRRSDAAGAAAGGSCSPDLGGQLRCCLVFTTLSCFPKPVGFILEGASSK